METERLQRRIEKMEKDLEIAESQIMREVQQALKVLYKLSAYFPCISQTKHSATLCALELSDDWFLEVS